MTRGQKFFAIAGGTVAVIILGWVLLVGVVFAWGGVATVSIHSGDGGPNLYLPIPLALVNAAVATGRQVVDVDHLIDIEAHIGAELGDWGPMVREMLEVIEECPDVTFVEVVDGDQHVKVFKQGRYLKVSVDDGDQFSVQVSLPARSVRQTIARLVS